MRALTKTASGRVLLFPLWIAAGCSGDGSGDGDGRDGVGERDASTAGYGMIAADDRSLRAAFNADSGRVPALLLASPT